GLRYSPGPSPLRPMVAAVSSPEEATTMAFSRLSTKMKVPLLDSTPLEMALSGVRSAAVGSPVNSITGVCVGSLQAPSTSSELATKRRAGQFMRSPMGTSGHAPVEQCHTGNGRGMQQDAPALRAA